MFRWLLFCAWYSSLSSFYHRNCWRLENTEWHTSFLQFFLSLALVVHSARVLPVQSVMSAFMIWQPVPLWWTIAKLTWICSEWRDLFWLQTRQNMERWLAAPRVQDPEQLLLFVLCQLWARGWFVLSQQIGLVLKYTSFNFNCNFFNKQFHWTKVPNCLVNCKQVGMRTSEALHIKLSQSAVLSAWIMTLTVI